MDQNQRTTTDTEVFRHCRHHVTNAANGSSQTTTTTTDNKDTSYNNGRKEDLDAEKREENRESSPLTASSSTKLSLKKLKQSLEDKKGSHSNISTDSSSSVSCLSVKDSAFYITVANVAVSELLQQTNPNSKGYWVPSDTETPNKVFIYQFLHSTDEYQHYMGKGIVHAQPQEIYRTLCDPFFRFRYDKIIETIEVLEKLDDNTYIARFVHTSNQCYMKVSRESILVIKYKEIIPNERYVLVGVTVQHPSFSQPNKHSLVQMDIKPSGWVIERNAKRPDDSIVAYITDTCIGGKVPQSIAKMLAKKTAFGHS
ncbi:hypothetical protein RFI_00697 [Reticulomyxa filosa]|uniref:START domain-containing protein n=1 Tax=Reticulomyxa filosa TaxID=46433 RepID=X6PD15_RETFI|nr:hypothetical protein RFI_00697 [Reticulomyxa filosa]|eukprot:ETO36365.1 hypothetical protein RFI_00697 [Reticulomyxa filosa]